MRGNSRVAFLVLWLTLTLIQVDQSFTSENNALWESLSEEGIIFFSDDDEHERIIAALDGSSSTSEESTKSVELHQKRTNKLRDASKPANPKEKRQSAAKFTKGVVQQVKKEPIYSYLPLPEIYRVKHATIDVVPKQPESSIPVTASSTQPAVGMEEQSSFDTQVSPWVRDFLLRHTCDQLLPVPRDFCVDNFNLLHLASAIERIGIQSLAPNESIPASSKPYPIYRAALRLIVQDEPVPEHVPVDLQTAATALFLLIHQRYAMSPRGLDLLRRRFQRGSAVFGRCPRISCSGMPLLPYGDSDNLNPMEYMPTENNASVENPSISLQQRRVKRYCALCGESFYHWESEIDGCAWGTSCCHLFWMVYGKDVFAEWLEWKPSRHSPNEARIFGFRLHPSAHLTATNQ
ncbi:hypothetical protein FisN_16Hh188 [Fistulifera solaris]|jgi:casein kinase II subunit beta|uniref:Casein kinase II subunit beta n=1 Tax=Fistulifera solaris TaxID=1519565 RepID=A0A1Z5KST7_FISSO|nr:hypothetical protein FisN_16Hh188 [Fistulifera solaris]|eukprot:GAX29373.1 hypothetical protein FisN_16Hh188 [Fistulifera solaris]